MKTCFKPYITQEAGEHLKQHKYSGVDDGITQAFFWNPIASSLVTLLPDSVAPNTLTLLGFVHAVVPPIMMYTLFGCQLMGDLPSWFMILQAYAYLVYRIFDEADGKQARRTGNSSPLGLIFDHGCDCFAVGL
jgi:ethanolaminephosphotransferase